MKLNPWKDSPRASRTFLLLASVLFLTETARSAFLLSFLPAYAEAFDISVATVGAAVSVHYAADTLVKVAAGYVLDRFPARLVLRGFLLAGTLGLCLAYFGKEPWLFIVGAALLGIGASPVWLLVLSRVKETSRAAQMGSIYTIWLAALGIGPVAVNFVIDRGLPLSFGLIAGFWLAGSLVAAGTGIEYKPGGHGLLLPPNEQLRRMRKQLAGMKPLMPGMVLQTAAAGLLIPVLPTFASNYLNLSYSEYSIVLVAGGLFTALLLVPMGKWSDKWGYRRFLIAGFVFLSLALYALPYARDMYTALPLGALLGAAYSAVLPAWNALMSHFVQSGQKATDWGVLSGVEGLGVMIGPIAGGWLASRFSEPAAIAASATLLLAIAVFYAFNPVHTRASRVTNKSRERQ
ncbi:MFS transporter [Paenibacillus arenilitoris]|uniref:MFS transporter n=1 Tax=Paenibacillus arenilitoris TaxID=2772299 RepID=A0A927H4Q4_9BACL|nr:MFS transporter [Paenibacillus arenilitoris]MBD2867632.1 MFS transporter [Paenibacillus arenilitoris]